MTDRRLLPDPDRITQRRAARVIKPLADLCRIPEGPRDRQLLWGESVTALGQEAGWTYIQAAKDGYCGYLPAGSLEEDGEDSAATHRVAAPATHAYQHASFKSPDRVALSFGSLLHVATTEGKFAVTDAGHVPLCHLAPVTQHETDPVAVAALFLGTPYLWGGNSCWGIDCSGLVQAALTACGIPCPGDSDQQATLGAPASGPFQRNDLLFWKGHVAMVSDAQTLIHANAHSMSVAFEGIAAALTRIEAGGDGPMTAHRRLAVSSG